ncbi:MAG: hypothetical protein ACTJH9_14815 [Pseudoalteromonas sp.]|uniref:hypothetical protein n=1 Tax=unclassified Pseudoalteromonas TaxID=194690 RepID=UPI003F99A393
MLVTALCLSLPFSISTYLHVPEKKQFIVNKFTILAQIVSFNAQETVLFDDRKTKDERLKLFETTSLVKGIHIYALNDVTKKPCFY